MKMLEKGRCSREILQNEDVGERKMYQRNAGSIVLTQMKVIHGKHCGWGESIYMESSDTSTLLGG